MVVSAIFRVMKIFTLIQATSSPPRGLPPFNKCLEVVLLNPPFLPLLPHDLLPTLQLLLVQHPGRSSVLWLGLLGLYSETWVSIDTFLTIWISFRYLFLVSRQLSCRTSVSGQVSALTLVCADTCPAWLLSYWTETWPTDTCPADTSPLSFDLSQAHCACDRSTAWHRLQCKCTEPIRVPYRVLRSPRESFLWIYIPLGSLFCPQVLFLLYRLKIAQKPLPC